MTTKKNPLLVKKHWHLLVYEVAQIGLPRKISLYAGSRKSMISMPEIEQARTNRGIPQEAVLIGHSYFGFGSQSELTGELPEKPATLVSPEYIEGLTFAAKAPDGALPENPYAGVENQAYAAQEWQLGYQTGVGIRNPLDNPIK